MSAARCKSCGAEVRWELTENSKRMPLDLDATDEGNVVVIGDHRPVARVFRSADEARGWLLMHVGEGPFLPHWASCPNADQHRTTQRKEAA